jgi:hypothetical protein
MCDFRRAMTPGVDVSVGPEDAIDLAVVKTHKHNAIVASLQNDFTDRS